MRRLARGGMGDVYVARGTDGSSVALKVVAAASEDDLRRATREAALLARVHHPNVVPVVGAGTCEGFAFCAMAMLDGRSLESVRDSPATIWPSTTSSERQTTPSTNPATR